MNQARSETTLRWRLMQWQTLVGLLSMMLFAATVVLRSNTSQATSPIWLDVVLQLSAVLMIMLGLLIRRYRPENRLWWVCLLSGALFQLGLTGITYLYNAIYLRGTLLYMEKVILWFTTGPIYGVIILEFILLPLWFPNGRFVSEGWRRAGWIVLTVATLCVMTYSILPGPIDLLEGTPLEGSVHNPFGLEWSPLVRWQELVGTVSIGFLLVGLLIAVVSVMARWHGASAEVRQQIKIVAVFIGIVFTLYPLAEIATVVGSGPVIATAYNVALVILWLGYPLAIGTAILFNRLFDIDVIIRRTLVYGAITALLAGVYFGGVVMLQAAFRAVTGQNSQLAVVITTLAIAALFTPLRNRMQRFVDRRFYRQKYDAEQTLEAFSETLRDEVDLDTLTGRLVDLVQETMQPEHLQVWLSDTRGD